MNGATDGAVTEVVEDVYVRRAHDLRPTVSVPLIGDAPDEDLVERWSVELMMEQDPDRVFARSWAEGK